jgi:hypothetical protein
VGNMHGVCINSNYWYNGNIKFDLLNDKSHLIYETICDVEYSKFISFDESQLLNLSGDDCKTNIELSLLNSNFSKPLCKYLNVWRYWNETEDDIKLNICAIYKNSLIISDKITKKNLLAKYL